MYRCWDCAWKSVEFEAVGGAGLIVYSEALRDKRAETRSSKDENLKGSYQVHLVHLIHHSALHSGQPVALKGQPPVHRGHGIPLPTFCFCAIVHHYIFLTGLTGTYDLQQFSALISAKQLLCTSAYAHWLHLQKQILMQSHDPLPDRFSSLFFAVILSVCKHTD